MCAVLLGEQHLHLGGCAEAFASGCEFIPESCHTICRVGFEYRGGTSRYGEHHGYAGEAVHPAESRGDPFPVQRFRSAQGHVFSDIYGRKEDGREKILKGVKNEKESSHIFLSYNGLLVQFG